MEEKIKKLTYIKTEFYSKWDISVISKIENFISELISDNDHKELFFIKLKLLESFIINKESVKAKIEFDDCLLQLLGLLNNLNHEN